jgi:hypothetical protein
VRPTLGSRKADNNNNNINCRDDDDDEVETHAGSYVTDCKDILFDDQLISSKSDIVHITDVETRFERTEERMNSDTEEP